MSTETSPPGPSQQEQHGLQLAEISNAMVGLFKKQFGRGPTKAATYYAGPDCIVSVLENSLTPAERRMAELGDHQRLRDIRLFFQHASEEEFRAVIEEITGRKVRGFTSATDTHRDISTEVFLLEPERGSGSRS